MRPIGFDGFGGFELVSIVLRMNSSSSFDKASFAFSSRCCFARLCSLYFLYANTSSIVCSAFGEATWQWNAFCDRVNGDNQRSGVLARLCNDVTLAIQRWHRKSQIIVIILANKINNHQKIPEVINVSIVVQR